MPCQHSAQVHSAIAGEKAKGLQFYQQRSISAYLLQHKELLFTAWPLVNF